MMIALRYLRARRKDAFISVTTLFTGIGVTIGVAALTVMLSVMGGFEANLRDRMLNLSPQIQVASFAGSMSNYGAIEDRADSIAGVAGSDPFIVGQALVSSAHGISGAIVRGIEPANPAVVAELARYIEHGRLEALAKQFPLPAPGDSKAPLAAIAVGSDLAARLGVKPGDALRMVAPILSGSSSEIATRTGAFVVGAVFDSGVEFIDRQVIFMGLGAAQNFFGRPGKADGVELRLKNLDDTGRITAELRHRLGSGYRVANWMEFNEEAAAGFALLKRLYAMVLLMLIAVAAFNLVATLIMVVMEKRKDIAVLLAMGATPREIRLIFVLKGMIVGAAGTLTGLAVGALGCFALAHYQFIHIPSKIYGVSTLPVDIRPLDFAAVAVASMILCLLATLYPARQGSRETPVEVFRS